ncbi:hypothetical protein FC43_GL000320 [Limosilactobacillus ingluviei DSM 15946]|uniref:HTH tetR-type domain-containing protein n=2 Tax=Limosilactobacillus ingluviei TaxID=148604 RepID=A0A0R1UFW6_9LACO|nr:hypothetical protein FC43_GL000320 [Limosilactobacillus ingluviei DSM 15946]
MFDGKQKKGENLMKMNRTVRDFQNALETLLENQPFERLTVDQICNEALLHRSSFYRYFHDKYDLLEQTINQRLSTLWEQSLTEDELIETLITYVNQHKKFFRNLTTTGSRDSLYSELMRMCSEILLGLRDKGPRDAAIVQVLHNAPNPALAAYSISGAIMGALYWWQEQNYDISDEEVISFVKRAIKVLPQVEA